MPRQCQRRARGMNVIWKSMDGKELRWQLKTNFRQWSLWLEGITKRMTTRDLITWKMQQKMTEIKQHRTQEEGKGENCTGKAHNDINIWKFMVKNDKYKRTLSFFSLMGCKFDWTGAVWYRHSQGVPTAWIKLWPWSTAVYNGDRVAPED